MIFLAKSLYVTLSLNVQELICLHTVKWFQVLLLNTNNSKQGRTHKRCTLMDLHTWPCKSRTTSMNIHSAAM